MNRLRELRIASGFTQEALGKHLGVQKAAICKYELGRVNIPPELLFQLSRLFSVSIDYILGHSSQPGGGAEFATLPIVGRVHAGSPILAEENVYDYISVPADEIRNGEYFFMEVVGDCMIDAHIVEGALVLVKMQPQVENGQIAVIRLEDEVVLRRVKRIKGQLILYPANPAYDPMVIAGGDAQIIGRVVEVRIRDI